MEDLSTAGIRLKNLSAKSVSISPAIPVLGVERPVLCAMAMAIFLVTLDLAPHAREEDLYNFHGRHNLYAQMVGYAEAMDNEEWIEGGIKTQMRDSNSS